MKINWKDCIRDQTKWKKLEKAKTSLKLKRLKKKKNPTCFGQVFCPSSGV
jgi:hypothetical protein